MVATEKELGVKGATISNLVKDLIKKRALPASYKVARRTRGKDVYVYVINSAKIEEAE
jgi:hypothetical protein